MKKIQIKIIVQELSETGSEFGQRLEQICNEMIGESKFYELSVKFTTASDGRQTANIIYFNLKQ